MYVDNDCYGECGEENGCYVCVFNGVVFIGIVVLGCGKFGELFVVCCW